MAVEELPGLRSLGDPIVPKIDSIVPGQTGILPDEQSEYGITDLAYRELMDYVAKLENEHIGTPVGKIDFTDTKVPLLDRILLLEKLPEGLSEQEFMNAILLANLIECATISYGQVFHESGDRYGAFWLKRFTDHIWVPDELQHADPFKLVLLQAGYSEDELDRMVRDVKERVYTHTSGDTPVQMTMFGVVQEEITDVWHGLLANILDKVNPELARLLRSVKRRESLHRIWYRDQTAIQIRDNSKLRHLATDTLGRFHFPGEVLVPNLFEGSVDLIPKMGRDIKILERDLVRMISSSLTDRPEYLGEAIFDVLHQRSADFGIPFTGLLHAISRTPRLGYAVNHFIGLVIHEREGIRLKGQEPQGVIQTKIWQMTSPLRSLIVHGLDQMEFVK